MGAANGADSGLRPYRVARLFYDILIRPDHTWLVFGDTLTFWSSVPAVPMSVRALTDRNAGHWAKRYVAAT
jgi:hypothetical protein